MSNTAGFVTKALLVAKVLATTNLYFTELNIDPAGIVVVRLIPSSEEILFIVDSSFPELSRMINVLSVAEYPLPFTVIFVPSVDMFTEVISVFTCVTTVNIPLVVAI